MKKKVLAILLAAVMVMALVPTMAFADELNNSADIKGTITLADFAYTMVIPSDTTLTENAHSAVLLGTDGKVTVKDIKHGDATIDVFYTVDLTNGNLKAGNTTITTTYGVSNAANGTFTTLAENTLYTVYTGGEIKDTFVNVTADEDKWNAAPAGDYTATVVFNFSKTSVVATTAADLTSAIRNANSGDVIGIGGGDLELTAKMDVNQNVTIVGDGQHAIENYPTYVGANNTVTFKNVKFDKTTATGEASSVYGQSFKGTLIFDGCTFDLNKWEAIQITPAADCTIIIRNCTFIGFSGAQRFIHIQPVGNANNAFKLDVTVTNCTFKNCDLVNYKKKTEETVQEVNKGSVIDFDFFAPGSTITMGGNTFALSTGVENYQLHPYFCSTTGDNYKELVGDVLLGYLTGTVHTYTVTATGLTY